VQYGEKIVDLKRRLFDGFAFSLALFLAFSFVYVFPKEKKSNSEPQATFRVQSNIVVLNATVTDKDGNSVTDLTVKDFKIYDDGKPQKLDTFALESYGSAELEESDEPGSTESEKAKSPVAAKRAALKPKDTRPRMISIIIDDLTMAIARHNAFIVSDVKRFIQNDMKPGDYVSILSASKKVQLPFSNNKQQILETLETLVEKLNDQMPVRPCPGLPDYVAWALADHADPTRQGLLFDVEVDALAGEAAKCSCIEIHLADDEEEPRSCLTPAGQQAILYEAAKRQNTDIEFRTYGLLDTLRQNIRALKHFEGTKNIIVFSDGFLAQNKTNAAYQLQELINLALRSGIVINTIGTRGFATYTGIPTWRKDLIEADKTQQYAPLEQMANETGGLHHIGNDMHKPLRLIANRRYSYYIMTYGMPSNKKAGEYHKIKLDVTRPGLTLTYRKGYYTPKEELRFETNKKEDILAALSDVGNMSEIPMTLAYNYSQEIDFSYTVSFITNVDMHDIRFIEEDARRKNQVSLILVAFDENDKYISGLEKAIDFQLLEKSYAGLRDRGLASKVDLNLPPGRYKVKAVVRENTQGRMGSITKSVEIP
jgi:VWFA-related protein